ncbi:MAG: DUF1232 domain-containing protein [Candidatus Woesearchaeota archaeon]
MERTFVDYLRLELKTLDDYGKDFDRTLLHLPDFIELLCDLLDEDVVDRGSRLIINAALGYLLVPNDVVPEDVYGTYGYMDDMYISAIVLANMKKSYPQLIEKLWDSKENLDEKIDLCIYTSEKFLDEKNLKEKVLRYCGLGEDMQ